MDMNITINGFVEKSTAHYAPVPGDYVGEDGLIYCGKCHTPKQHRIIFLGEEKIPGIPCRCEAEEIARRERERIAIDREVFERYFMGVPKKEVVSIVQKALEMYFNAEGA